MFHSCLHLQVTGNEACCGSSSAITCQYPGLVYAQILIRQEIHQLSSLMTSCNDEDDEQNTVVSLCSYTATRCSALLLLLHVPLQYEMVYFLVATSYSKMLESVSLRQMNSQCAHIAVAK